MPGTTKVRTHRSIFLQDVKQAFPEIRKALNAESGLLHNEMHVYLNFVCELIADSRAKEVVRAFLILEHHYRYGNQALLTAIVVSFLEDLDLGVAKGITSWAHAKLPPILREAYEELRP